MDLKDKRQEAIDYLELCRKKLKDHGEDDSNTFIVFGYILELLEPAEQNELEKINKILKENKSTIRLAELHLKYIKRGLPGAIEADLTKLLRILDEISKVEPEQTCEHRQCNKEPEPGTVEKTFNKFLDKYIGDLSCLIASLENKSLDLSEGAICSRNALVEIKKEYNRLCESEPEQTCAKKTNESNFRIKYDGVEAEEISDLLYSISTEKGHHLLNTDQCFEITEEILKIINGGLSEPEQKETEEMTLEQAEYLAPRTDYAVFAIDEDDEMNMADAAQFFMEGYNYCIKKINKYPHICQLPEELTGDK